MRNYSFYTDTDRSNTARGYRLDFLASQAEALTAAELANQVDETYYYNGVIYGTLEERLDAERADTDEIANDAFAPKTEETAPLEPAPAEETTEDIAASEQTYNG